MFPVQWRGLRLVVVSVSDRLLESLARALDVVFKRLEERTMDKNDEIGAASPSTDIPEGHDD